MICEKCGRALKDAESIQRGYGPICYKKMNPQPIRSNGSPSGYNLADDKIILSRDRWNYRNLWIWDMTEGVEESD